MAISATLTILLSKLPNLQLPSPDCYTSYVGKLTEESQIEILEFITGINIQNKVM